MSGSYIYDVVWRGLEMIENKQTNKKILYVVTNYSSSHLLMPRGSRLLNPTSNYIHTAVSEHFLSNNHSDTHQCYLFLLKNIKMNAIHPGRHVRLTLFTRLRLLSL